MSARLDRIRDDNEGGFFSNDPAGDVRHLLEQVDHLKGIVRWFSRIEPRAYDGGPDRCLYCDAVEQWDGAFIHNVTCPWVAAVVEMEGGR